ncbi:MAG: hypothetical protein J5I94_23340 [Phaeodactylibacter sp.]|nr:hypothetical protein [Phaeodactylibacter sp.]
MSQPSLKPLEIEALLTQYRSDLRKLEYQVHQTQAIIQELEKQAAEVQEALAFEESKALPSAEKAKAAPSAESKPKKAKRGPGRPRKTKTAATKETAAAKEEAPKAEEKAAEAEKTAAKGKSPKSAPGKKKGAGRPRKSAGAQKTGKTAKKDAAEKKERGYRLSEWDKFVVDSLKTKQQALITKDFVDIAKANPDIKSGEAQIKVKLNRSLHKLSNKKGSLVKVEHSGRGFAYALSEWVNNKGELPKKYAR